MTRFRRDSDGMEIAEDAHGVFWRELPDGRRLAPMPLIAGRRLAITALREEVKVLTEWWDKMFEDVWDYQETEAA
ncbi:MAG TPA: hypothetical protein VFE42_31960 [Chloroflexota bacterium]|nr:hypothetical protein [Chloroflexota bacterium]HZS92085.1 hypothetical protein [Chloroflexota bacterium]